MREAIHEWLTTAARPARALLVFSSARVRAMWWAENGDAVLGVTARYFVFSHEIRTANAALELLTYTSAAELERRLRGQSLDRVWTVGALSAHVMDLLQAAQTLKETENVPQTLKGTENVHVMDLLQAAQTLKETENAPQTTTMKPDSTTTMKPDSTTTLKPDSMTTLKGTEGAHDSH